MLPGIGVFGTGSVVRVIVPLLRDKGFKVEAIWGRTLNEAAQTASQLSIPFHTNHIDDVLLRKDVDLIFILCSPNLHAQIAVKALGIGKHVVCDRPAGLSQADAFKMVRASQYYPSLISILNHSLRFLPAFTQMRSTLAQGLIGKLTVIDVNVRMPSLLARDSYDWLCDATMGGGTLTLVGSHVLDLITHVTGRKATRVHAVIRTFNQNTAGISGIRNITSPDFCAFQVELGENGGLVTATLNTHMTGAFSQEIVLCGTDGHLIARGSDLTLVRGDHQEVLFSDEGSAVSSGDSAIPMPYLNGLCHMIHALREAFLPVEDKKGWIKEPVTAAATFEDGLYVQVIVFKFRGF